jgi:hypothetical protein
LAIGERIQERNIVDEVRRVEQLDGIISSSPRKESPAIVGAKHFQEVRTHFSMNSEERTFLVGDALCEQVRVGRRGARLRAVQSAAQEAVGYIRRL